MLDYNTDFKTPALQALLYAPDEFRVSDHDPVIVDLVLNAAPTVSAGGPYTVEQGGIVLVTATGSDPDGDNLVYAWDLDNNGSFETVRRKALFYAAHRDPLSTHTIRVQVTDPAGLTAVSETTVYIQYRWTGFFHPINNRVTNKVKAGQSIPVKFSLGGNQGLDIFAAGYPKAQVYNCQSGAAGATEETVTAGNSGLQYNPRTRQYTYTWKTNKAWANTCRRLIVTLVDGATHTANFRFTK